MTPNVQAHAPQLKGAPGSPHPFWHRPHSRMGRLAMWFLLAAALFMVALPVLMMVNTGYAENSWQRMLAIGYGFVMLACWLTSGVLAALAILRQSERSWVAWLALIPGLFALTLLIGEFVGGPH